MKALEVLLIVLLEERRSVSLYLRGESESPWNNGLAPRTSRSVVLESSYSMVQLFSPTSGSQE